MVRFKLLNNNPAEGNDFAIGNVGVFPKLRVPCGGGGVQIMRIIVCWSLYRISPIYRNYHVPAVPTVTLLYLEVRGPK